MHVHFICVNPQLQELFSLAERAHKAGHMRTIYKLLPQCCFLGYTYSVRNKDVKVVGQMSEHFEFGSDIFNLGRTLFVWISMSHMYNVKSPLKFTPPFQVPCSM